MRNKKAEAVSKTIKDILNKVEQSLINDYGFSAETARYIVGLYEAIKDKDLFKSKYFDGIEFELDEGDSIPDIGNVQQLAKDPNLFYEIVMYALHSQEFTKYYKIGFDGENVTISKRAKSEIEKSESTGYKTKFDEYKVGEDANYVTFEIPDYAVGNSMRKFFVYQFPNDKRIVKNEQLTFPNHCIISSSSGSFSSQKCSYSDKWYITFSKQNPIDKVIDYINSFKTNLKLSDERANALIKKLNNDAISQYDSEFHALKDILGEVYLAPREILNREKFKTQEKDLGSNYGYHTFSNVPNGGSDKSRLYPRLSYDYETFKTLKSSEFTIENNSLLSYNTDATYVIIPDGVVDIRKDAFVNVKVEEIVLPASLMTIRNGAFKNCNRLKYVRATDNLTYIQHDAFDNNTLNGGKPLIGVFEKHGNDYIVRKPIKLSYYPKDKINTLLRSNVVVEGKINNVNEVVRIKKPMYVRDDRGLYIIEDGEIFFNKDFANEAYDETLTIPEGVKSMGSELYGSFNEVIFPSTIETIDTVRPFQNNESRILDLSKCLKLKLIERMFTQTKIRDIILPENVVELDKSLLFLSKSKSITIPSNTKLDPNSFRSSLISIIYTDNVDELTKNIRMSLGDKAEQLLNSIKIMPKSAMNN